jgi:hypothetical protein
MSRPTRVLWCATIGIIACAVSIPAGLILMERAERARQAAERARRAAAEPWRESADWSGTDIGGLPVLNTVEQVFLNDPPAPDVRRKHCEPFLSQLIGWSAVVDSVTPDGDGWSVAVSVSPRIRSRVTHTNAKTVETWHISADGRARCDSCESGGPYFVMRD